VVVVVVVAIFVVVVVVGVKTPTAVKQTLLHQQYSLDSKPVKVLHRKTMKKEDEFWT